MPGRARGPEPNRQRVVSLLQGKALSQRLQVLHPQPERGGCEGHLDRVLPRPGRAPSVQTHFLGAGWRNSKRISWAAYNQRKVVWEAIVRLGIHKGVTNDCAARWMQEYFTKARTRTGRPLSLHSCGLWLRDCLERAREQSPKQDPRPAGYESVCGDMLRAGMELAKYLYRLPHIEGHQ